LFGPIYNLSQDKLLAFWKYINENLQKEFIRHSKSPTSLPILFVKKNDGSLHMCVDYRGLNQLTIKNRYPLPLILGLLNQLSHTKVYTKIDLRRAYNLVSIWEGAEWKIAFKTHYIHFEYVMMPFGFTNAHVAFQHMINDVFHEYLDDFVACYIDDIFIFLKNMVGPWASCTIFFLKLWEVGFYVKLEKCGLHQSKVDSCVILFLEMAFAWTLIRFKPLWIGLPQLLFEMFNVSLCSPTFINNSLHIIPQ
jgi:hypothetical protein